MKSDINNTSSFPNQARAVIIGAGIVGASVAYHLTKIGWSDVLILERDTVSSGTTGHGAGLVTQLRHTKALTNLARYSVDLYANLEKETGYNPGFKQSGSISVARTKGRADEFLRQVSMARAFGVEIERISPKEAKRLWPLMEISDVVEAIHIPHDGQTVPDATTMAMITGACSRGARLIENTRVVDINTQEGEVQGVVTERGEITCEVILNCTGMWAREVGEMCGVGVPLHAADHAYLVTNTMDGITSELPSLRDPDGYIYFRSDIENRGGLLMGGFEPISVPWGMGGIPDDFGTHLLDRDWSHYNVFLEKAIQRVPSMEDIEILRFLVGPESFAPDNNYVIGESPEVKNFFVAAGFNSSGIAAAAGAGRAIAEWAVEGHPTMDLSDVDIRRFHKFQNGSNYLRDRVTEGLGLLYATHWPNRQPETARGARRSPLHDRLAEQGACFGTVAGWERANWYGASGIESKYEYSWHRQNWFEYSAEEHRAVREKVGLFDQTSFAKFLMEGQDATSVLQNLCANNIDVKSGRVIYTAMLNRLGGIEADLTVTRCTQNSYLIVTGAASATRDFTWINQHIPSQAKALLTDISSSYSAVGLMGPQSRNLLSAVSDFDFSKEDFPFMTSRDITVGYASVRATRITYVGELGWELYIPTEFTTHVYDRLIEAGTKFELKHAGYHAMDSLRVEKGYRSWGHDINNQVTPLEAGLGFAVDFRKDPPFIGREALLAQIQKPTNRRLMIFMLNNSEDLLLGEEPIYRDGILVGSITSGAYGHTLGCGVGMGYVNNVGNPIDPINASYEIEIAMKRVPAKASIQPPYDPRGLRVRM